VGDLGVEAAEAMGKAQFEPSNEQWISKKEVAASMDLKWSVNHIDTCILYHHYCCI
jgi:hypothetical protein